MIALNLFLLYGVGEFKPPLEHHLEDDIKVGAIRLDTVNEELAFFWLDNP